MGGPFIIILAYGLSENMTTYYYTVVMIIIELLVNTRNGAIHQFLEREGWINDATWDNQTGIGSGRMEGWLSYHMMVDQEEKTFGSVASLATGLTSAPTDMLYCFSGFVVLTQIFDVINFFSKWVSTINRQRHITNITCRLGVQKTRLTVFWWSRGLLKSILHKNVEQFCFRNFFT